MTKTAKALTLVAIITLATSALQRVTGKSALAIAGSTAAAAQERVLTHTWHSDVLDEQREIRVALPRGYEAASIAYPVMYLLDGRFNLDHTINAVDYLAAHSRIPEMIIVAVHNVSRELDMTPPWMTDLPPLLGEEPRGDRFLDFFGEELIPLIEREYRTQPLRLLVGHSHGGLFASYAFAGRPHLFQWHLALDAPMHLDDRSLAERITILAANTPQMEKRLVSVEEQFGWPDQSWEELEAAAPPGLALARIDGLNETHESMAFLGTYLGLKELFFDYPESSNRARTLEELVTQYERISGAYGYSVSIPRQYLVRNAEGLLVSRRGSQAKELVDRAREMYGTSPVLAELEQEADDVIRTGEVTSNKIVDELLGSPPVSPDALSAFLGVWVGRAAHEGGTPMDLVVRFEPQGDEVVGSTSITINHRGSGEGTPHEFIRILEEGRTLEWGYLNPRGGGGIAVYTVTLQESGELVGVQEIRGFELKLPEGFVIPVTRVTLRRRP
jgi:predicted alpha/beta superfamily hydrolase